MHPEILENAVREADVAIIDLMGVSEALREIVRRGLEECRGQRIVIGNELREYLRLGTFPWKQWVNDEVLPEETADRRCVRGGS